MQTKIHHEFWADEKLEDAPSEVRLAILWMLTNSRMSHIGHCRISPKRFTFETGLDAMWIERACDALAMGIVRTSEGVYFRNFLRWQFATGKKGGTWYNNKILIGSYALVMGIGSPSVEEAFKEDYPELYDLEIRRSKQSPSPSPCHPHSMGEGEGEGVREGVRKQGGLGETSLLVPAPPGVSAEDPLVEEEFERAVGAISRWYGREGAWSFQERRDLLEAYQPGDMAIMSAYRTASGHDQQEQKNWPKKMPNLLRAWGSNVARARVYLAEEGIAAGPATPAPASKAALGPPGWQAAAIRLYPTASVPGRWLELPASVRREIETALTAQPVS
jgi:hypothetical protein